MTQDFSMTVGFTELHNLVKVQRCGKEVKGTAEGRLQRGCPH